MSIWLIVFSCLNILFLEPLACSCVVRVRLCMSGERGINALDFYYSGYSIDC